MTASIDRVNEVYRLLDNLTRNESNPIGTGVDKTTRDAIIEDLENSYKTDYLARLEDLPDNFPGNFPDDFPYGSDRIKEADQFGFRVRSFLALMEGLNPLKQHTNIEIQNEWREYLD
ncbi:hypothetical protein N9Y92_03150, partial [Chlamydiales bacterium]|nr:hypothetical protein [Chlamydiales bacterium]